MQNDVYREKLLQFDWNVPSSIARSSNKFRWQTVLEYKNPAREISWGPNIKNITIFERRDNTRLCKKRRKAKERQPNMTGGGRGGKILTFFLKFRSQDDGGIEYFNTIVVQPHLKLVTNQGRGFHVRCRYQTRDKVVTNDQTHVAMLQSLPLQVSDHSSLSLL